ncbi:hypothetical protein NDA13_005949 [Ustilago tritici]|nr:hypothetical protein NDA13_005949 [Ustilago tritici]
MPPIHSNASHCHASSTGTAFAPATGKTHVFNESTTLTTGHIQDNDSSIDLTSNQDGTNNPATVPSTSQCKDGSDEPMEDPYLFEPDQRAFQPIFTGRLVCLQCVLVGLALPHNYLALEILNVPQTNTPTATAHYVAQFLKTYAQMQDVWVCQVSYPNNPTPPTNTNVFITLISTPAGDEGGLDPVRLHAIPGYVQILTNECKLNYVGQLKWYISCHQAVLGQDCGILLQNTKWVIKETLLQRHATYAWIYIPNSKPALGQTIHILHLWSIHAPPDNTNRCAFWEQDKAGLS